MPLVSSFTVSNDNDFSVQLLYNGDVVEILQSNATSAERDAPGLYQTKRANSPAVLLEIYLPNRHDLDKHYTTSRNSGDFKVRVHYRTDAAAEAQD